AAVADAVPRNTAGTEYFFDVVQALDRRGLIDDEFFDRLAQERPRKKGQIKVLEELWGDEERNRATVRKPPQEVVNSIGMKLKLIPAGKFQMGSTERYDEKPRHLVTISRPFYLGVYPVAQREYLRMLKKKPSYFRGHERLPVQDVSWFQA